MLEDFGNDVPTSGVLDTVGLGAGDLSWFRGRVAGFRSTVDWQSAL